MNGPVVHSQSLSACPGDNDRAFVSRALCAMGDVALHRGEYGDAEALLEESLRLGREVDYEPRSPRHSCRVAGSPSCSADPTGPNNCLRSASTCTASWPTTGAWRTC